MNKTEELAIKIAVLLDTFPEAAAQIKEHIPAPRLAVLLDLKHPLHPAPEILTLQPFSESQL